MKLSGTTQVQVADLSGLSQAQISRFLKGTRGDFMQHTTVVAIEKACDAMQKSAA
jgi:predicted transcriptional regulator